MRGVGSSLALDEIMPWAVTAPRLGRGWVTAAEPATLKARWARLTRAEPAERDALFEVTRSRTPYSAVPQLPGHPAPGGRLAREHGPCPEPVRVTDGPFDRQWLIPDNRVIDAARPELWRVTDDTHQIHAVEHPGAGLTYSALLPVGRRQRIRPLYRRPGGLDPNLAPGLLGHLARRLGLPVAPEDVLAWTAVGTLPGVTLTADPGLWAEGVTLGREILWLHTYGARCGTGRPRMPGGRRPYVRAAVPERPGAAGHDPGEQALRLGDGVISPVPEAAWQFAEPWCERRTSPGEPGTLGAVGDVGWPRSRTSELLELITVVALLDDLGPRRRDLTARVAAAGDHIAPEELRAAGVLPVPDTARRPASVLDHHEEGPDGQFALL